MKKLIICLLLLLGCSVTRTNFENLYATPIPDPQPAIELSGWECVGNVVLYTDNGHGYVYKSGIDNAKLFVKRVQGYTAMKVVTYGWYWNGQTPKPEKEYYVNILNPVWRPAGACSGEKSVPSSFNAKAGEYYFNI